MRIIVFFDLPVATIKDRREYSRFRRFLIKNGFIMLQESVYCKLAQNQSVVESVSESIRKNKPPKGIVQTLVIRKNNIQEWNLLSEAETAILYLPTGGLLNYDACVSFY